MKYSRLADPQSDPSDDHALFQAMAEHVVCLSESVYPTALHVAVEDVPRPVQVSWQLWCFASQVAGNGLPDYFLNHCSSAEEAQAYLAALREVNATELVEMFEACIPMAVAAEGELLFVPGADWFRAFQAPSRWSSLAELDGPSMALAASPLSQLVAAYLRAHASEI